MRSSETQGQASRRGAALTLVGLAVALVAITVFASGLLSPSQAAPADDDAPTKAAVRRYDEATPEVSAEATQDAPAEATPEVTPDVTQAPAPPPGKPNPSLSDFWSGAAQWVLDVADTGLPVGESDTIYRGNGEYWSYLHASTQSAGITDSCGDPVDIPGCVTRWVSTDGGQHFSLSSPTCLINCTSCPCAAEDMTNQQQYPRVAQSATGQFYMVFENAGAAFLTTSTDGLAWTAPQVNESTGLWKLSDAPCRYATAIGPHPWTNSPYHCMAGGPPGIVVTNGRLYEFIGLGQNPAHMGCYWSWLSNVYRFFQCSNNPILRGAKEYGPLDALGAAANPYFDFRYMTSADVVKDGAYYYMAFEGVRGPSSFEVGRDNQFALGFARSANLNDLWIKYRGNPALQDVADNWGVGHADIVVADGITSLYTATPGLTRGRFVLVWK